MGTDPTLAREYVRKVAQWVLDRHDEACDGLGLGAIDEDERTQFERLVAGTTTLTKLQPRRSSYMAGALLDAVCLTGADELYDAVRRNLNVLRVVPSGTRALESHARWRRGGPDVHPQPRIDYPEWKNRTASEPLTDAAATDAVLLASVARTRHYLSAYEALLAIVPAAIN